MQQSSTRKKRRINQQKNLEVIDDQAYQNKLDQKNLRKLQQTYGQRMSVTLAAETETGMR